MGIEKVIASAMSYAVDLYAVSGGAKMPPTLEQEIEAALLGVWLKEVREKGREITEEFKDLYPQLESKRDTESLYEQLLREFAELYGAKSIRDISLTTARQISDLIASGQAKGLTRAEIVSKMRDSIPVISKMRAGVIVATEGHAASMYAGQGVARRSRRPLIKKWISVSDHRTRDFGESDGVIDEFSHRKMNGVIVPMDQPYMVPRKNGTREPMMFPGDPTASAGNRIRCRCVEKYKRA
jgi:uncharacterized protein with gpF-like domain